VLATLSADATGAGAAYDPAIATAPCAAPGPGTVRVPQDFALAYTIEPASGDWGRPRRMDVDAAGRFRLVELIPPPPGALAAPEERLLREGTLSLAGRRSLYAAVVACDLFALDGPFFDPARLEGSTAPVRRESAQTISVTADGRSHRVVVRNVPVERFLTVRSTLFAETGGL
jgi:hypothetical protein